MRYPIDALRRNVRSGVKSLCLLAGALALFAPLAGAQAAEVTLRLGHPVLTTHPFHDAAVRFRDSVKQHTNGAVEVQIFPSRQLGDAQELYNNVKLGTVDLTLADASSFPAIQPLQFPWLIGDYDDLLRVFRLPETRAMLAPKLAADGLEMLSMYEGGQFSFLTVNREIKTIDDFKELKTRVPPVRMHLDMWKAIGTNPTPIAYGELYTALETGTIDALGINLTSIFSEKFYEVGKHVLQTKHGYWPGVLVMNKRKFDSLKPSYQKAIRQAALETMEPQIEAIIRAEKSLIAKLKGLGVEFTEMSPRLKADLKAKVKPVIEQYSKNDPTVVNFVRAVEARP